MSGLVMPQTGLVTIGGFKTISVIPGLGDPVKESKDFFTKLGKYLDFVELAYNDILVGKYIPNKIGSLFTGTDTQNEQKWQGKCGVVLKYGPTAQADGFKYDVGDFVFYRYSDGEEIGLRCENDPSIMHCKILSPAHVIGKVSNPDVIW